MAKKPTAKKTTATSDPVTSDPEGYHVLPDGRCLDLRAEEGRLAYLRNLEERNPTLFTEQLAAIRTKDPHPVLVIYPGNDKETGWYTRPGTAHWFFPELRLALFQHDHPAGALFVLFTGGYTTFMLLERATEATPAPGMSKKDLREFARQERERADELEKKVAEIWEQMAWMEQEAAARRQIAEHAEGVAKTMTGRRRT
jgi:hypothetical protein